LLGIDPGAKRQAERNAAASNFEAITREWLKLRASAIDARTLQKKLKRFESFVSLHRQAPDRRHQGTDLLTLLRKMAARGISESAHTVRCALCVRDPFHSVIQLLRASKSPSSARLV
jgi:hypothetical protein